jgi:signal transduction histidine kinase
VDYDLYQWVEHHIQAYPWVIIAATLTHSFACMFHFTNAVMSAKVMRARVDLKDNPLIKLFLVSNALCSVLRVWAVQEIVYHASPSQSIQLLSTMASIITLACLWPLIPILIRLPSFEKLDDVNQALNHKVDELAQALLDLKREKDEKEEVQNSLLQSQKMEAVGQLTGGIAHDFNNLLFAVGGNLELIRHSPASPKVPRWVSTAIEAVERAAHLTAQLLTFSRVQKLQLKEVKLQPLINNLKDMIKRTIGTNIKIILNPVCNVTIMADPVQLELALLNLALNSRDAMPEGGTLTIGVVIVEDFVEIDVSDTGTGIPPAIMSKIFDPFFTTKDIGKGTGLGLSMVYGVATQSKGEVYIKKSSLKGTTITIKIPRVVNTTTDAEYNAVAAILTPISSKTILLIDDDANVRQTLRDILVMKDHVVTMSEDGVDALSHLKTNRPDLILVDYAMPVMNGDQVMKAAKLIYPDINIAFVTGFSDTEALKGYTVLKKPFKIEDIEVLLHTFFDN